MTYEENKKICGKFPPEIMYEGLRELIATVNAAMNKVVEPDDLEAQNDAARVHEIAYTTVNTKKPKEIDYPFYYTELQAIHNKYKDRALNKKWAGIIERQNEMIEKGIL
ncbi:MAG: hypothetical protein PHE73_08610 [Sulfurovaceae bacterium]|nr:hypothetical protein [Sulfurovaceae bacterium]